MNSLLLDRANVEKQNGFVGSVKTLCRELLCALARIYIRRNKHIIILWSRPSGGTLLDIKLTLVVTVIFILFDSYTLNLNVHCLLFYSAQWNTNVEGESKKRALR